jgi:hypothetical protein
MMLELVGSKDVVDERGSKPAAEKKLGRKSSKQVPV